MRADIGQGGRARRGLASRRQRHGVADDGSDRPRLARRGAPGLGRNALVEFAQQILATKDLAKGIPGTQLSWTLAQAGVVTNQIPERAVARGDVRICVPGGAEKLAAPLQTKVDSDRLVPDTVTTIRVGAGRPPLVANERARALAGQAQAIYAELDGRTLRLAEMAGGATDAGYAGRSGKAAVIEKTSAWPALAITRATNTSRSIRSRPGSI